MLRVIIMWTGWINRALVALPGCDDALFQNVWENKRLLFDGRHGVGDIVDYNSARLVAAALRRGERILVTLPDFQPHRPAFLFATALIRHFLDSHRQVGIASLRSDLVLYFGPNIGIREQLRRTSVQSLGLDLAKVFSQQDVCRSATGMAGRGPTQSSWTGSLPRVITVYSPADPIGVLQAYRPCWIAVDCSDAPFLAWLQPLLKETVQRGIPVVAWGHNPLSECIKEFSSFGHTFIWPPNSPRILNGELDALLCSQDPIYLGPVVLHGKSIDQFSASLRKAWQLLARATQHVENEGRFEKDAVAVHWKYFRSLESLAVPVDFYEAQAPRFWGLQSFDKLTAVCRHFRSANMQNDTRLYCDLEEVAILLQQARNNLENQGCALWEALINLCIEDFTNNEVRLLVFPSDSKKRLFLFAMLARHNTTEDDLREMRTYVTSLNELRRWMHLHYDASEDNGYDGVLIPSANAVWHPVLVGLPSPAMTPRLLYAFLHSKVDIVLYPHQCSSFMRRQAEWSMRLSGNPSRNVDTLACMSNVVTPQDVPDSNPRISVNKPVVMNVETTQKIRTPLAGTIWQPEDPVVEVERLFQADDECEDEGLILNDQPEARTNPFSESLEEIWCAEAVKVQFDQGWQAYFARDDVINVVSNGRLDRRYVRSLRHGERVLIIHGQQRQSLYDLIVSRVHKHPSIELHLAMIRRWQEDLRVAYGQWCTHTGEPSELRAYGARDLNGLLRRMRARGSQLVSSLTLSSWLKGFVLCPIDSEDLRRVGEVLNMGFVQTYYKRISQAASRLRGLHRGLSNRLNRWLQDQAAGAIQGNDDNIIDAELGLTFGDVRNSLLILRIRKIELVNGPFLRSTLGRLEKDT